MVKCPPLDSEVSSSLPGRVFFLILFLNFNDKCSWQFVKKFAYASFASLLLPIIHGLLLGITWPVYENNSLFTSSKRRKISNINKQNICNKIYKHEKKKGLWKGLVFRPKTTCINNCPHSCKFKNVQCPLGFEVKHSKILYRSFRACIII